MSELTLGSDATAFRCPMAAQTVNQRLITRLSTTSCVECSFTRYGSCDLLVSVMPSCIVKQSVNQSVSQSINRCRRSIVDPSLACAVSVRVLHINRILHCIAFAKITSTFNGCAKYEVLLFCCLFLRY